MHFEGQSRVRVSIVGCVVSAAFLALGAVAKVPSMTQFNEVVAVLLPSGLTGVSWAASFAVVGWEAALAVALCCRGWRDRTVVIAAIVTFAFFSIQLIRLWLDPSAPKCGCMGILGGGDGLAAHPGIGLARNAGLLYLLIGAIPRAASVPPAAGNPARITARGMSLLELLCVVAVSLILLAISVSALRGGREAGRAAASLHGLGQTMSGVSSYALEQRDAWPYIQTPGQFGARIVVGGRATGYSYFGGGRTFWANALFPEYIADEAFLQPHQLEVMHALNDREGFHPSTIRSRFVLTDVAFVRPEWFEGSEPPPDARLFDATRHADVRHPSRKGALVDDGFRPAARPEQAADGLTGVHAARADGSAAALRFHDRADDCTASRWRYGVPRLPIISTAGGWRGIDPGL